MIAAIAISAFAVFLFCSWAVFCRKFMDGIIAKHMLVFAAILSALTTLDPHNISALGTAVLLIALALGYIAFRHRRFIDRRERNRQPQR